MTINISHILKNKEIERKNKKEFKITCGDECDIVATFNGKVIGNLKSISYTIVKERER